jgi:hypothetical protein
MDSYAQIVHKRVMIEKHLFSHDELSSFLQQNATKALDDFNALFRAGTTGESVPNVLIVQAHTEIREACHFLDSELHIANDFNSFDLCNELRWTLIKTDLLEKKSKKSAILSKYEKEAKGSFKAQIKSELTTALDSKNLKRDQIIRLVKGMATSARKQFGDDYSSLNAAKELSSPMARAMNSAPPILFAEDGYDSEREERKVSPEKAIYPPIVPASPPAKRAEEVKRQIPVPAPAPAPAVAPFA